MIQHSTLHDDDIQESHGVRSPTPPLHVVFASLPDFQYEENSEISKISEVLDNRDHWIYIFLMIFVTAVYPLQLKNSAKVLNNTSNRLRQKGTKNGFGFS